MTAILYPVAETPEGALHAPHGVAAREREARALCHTPVRFVTELVGPAFATREAALDAYAGRVRDDRPDRPVVAPEQAWGRLVPVSGADGQPAKTAPARPVYREGRRWPAPASGAVGATLWRLSISYWRVETAGADPRLTEPARRLRRGEGGRDLDGLTLSALVRQPLRAMKPQQPLDIGLFEMRLPEAPDVIVPDE